MFNNEFDQNKIDGQLSNIAPNQQKWVPSLVKVKPSLQNYRLWATLQQQCNDVYEDLLNKLNHNNNRKYQR